MAGSGLFDQIKSHAHIDHRRFPLSRPSGSGVDIGDGMGGGVMAAPALRRRCAVLLALHQSHNVLAQPCGLTFKIRIVDVKCAQKAQGRGFFKFRPLLGTPLIGR
jgi:hypothetical protein